MYNYHNLRGEKNFWFGDFFTMPGANCSIYGCGTSRKHVGVGIFRIPSAKDEVSTKTREAWLNVITKDRVVDKSLRSQIDKGELYVCKNISGLKKLIVVSVFLFFFHILRSKTGKTCDC